jgi:hypothetical protein
MSMTQRLERQDARFFSGSPLRNLLFAVNTLFVAVILTRVISMMIMYWGGLERDSRFILVLFAAFCWLPWGFTLRLQRTVRNEATIIPDRFRSDFVRLHLTAMAFGYFFFFLALEVAFSLLRHR